MTRFRTKCELHVTDQPCLSHHEVSPSDEGLVAVIPPGAVYLLSAHRKHDGPVVQCKRKNSG